MDHYAIAYERMVERVRKQFEAPPPPKPLAQNPGAYGTLMEDLGEAIAKPLPPEPGELDCLLAGAARRLLLRGGKATPAEKLLMGGFIDLAGKEAVERLLDEEAAFEGPRRTRWWGDLGVSIAGTDRDIGRIGQIERMERARAAMSAVAAEFGDAGAMLMDLFLQGMTPGALAADVSKLRRKRGLPGICNKSVQRELGRMIAFLAEHYKRYDARHSTAKDLPF